MLPKRRVEIRTYRSHRLEVVDDGSSGWLVLVYAAAQGGQVARLHDPAPASLSVLVDAAQRRIDRLLDGAAA